jgi:hypothetical protein
LKFRASYGVTGSDNLSTTLYGTYDPLVYIVIFDNNTSRYVPISNSGLDYPNVTWQKTIMQNIGVDFYLFKNRVSGTIDIFSNDIKDKLGNANTAGLSMYSTYPINGAKQRRKGWDASLDTKNIVHKNYSWSTLLTLSHYKSLWMERMPGYDYNEYEKRGQVSTNARYYYKTDGIINSSKSNMPAYQPAAAQYPGYPIIVDKNKDGQITTDDIYFLDSTPKIYLGFGNTFSYKNIDFDIFMYSQQGIEKNNGALSTSPMELANENSNSTIYAKEIYHSEINPNGRLPGVARNLASVSLPGGAGTNVNYQNASYIRARNITLAYNFRGRQLGSLGSLISNARVYLDVQNAFTITKYEGFDPELNNSDNAFPQTRTFSLGLKLSFK